MRPHFITALATPLREDDSLHIEGLELLLGQQAGGGIHSYLVGGTMGAMQLLPDQTYRDLVTETVRLASGKGEILAGAGDTAFERTRERVEFLNALNLDGVVVLAPYVMPFSQDELVDYFTAVAEVSRAPVFLYDLPVLTRNKISAASAVTLSKHPNIAGIKCSDEPGYARQVRDLTEDDFRVILAAPTLTDVCLRSEFPEHLDGVYCLCPGLVSGIGRAAVAGDWARAAELQQGLNRTLRLLQSAEVWRPFTALMNELGIPRRFKPRPHRDWGHVEARGFLEQQETVEVLEILRAARGQAA